MIRVYTFINIATGEIYEVSVDLNTHKCGYLYAHSQAHKYFNDTLEYCDDMALLYSTNADGSRQIDHEADVYERMKYRQQSSARQTEAVKQGLKKAFRYDIIFMVKGGHIYDYSRY